MKLNHSMKKRLTSFMIIWLGVIIALSLFGIHAGVILVSALAFFTQWELYRLFERMDLKPMTTLGLACGLIIMLGSYYIGGIDSGNDLFLLSFLALTLAIIRMDLHAGRLRSFMPTLFGLIYVPFLLHYMPKVVKLAVERGNTIETGVFLCVWIVVVAKSADAGGLVVGKRYGRTPLSAVSPNKTLEGALGGIATAMLTGGALALFFSGPAPDGFNFFIAAFSAVPLAVASIASDLVESAFKRQAGVKDSGQLIPGIGGVFDLTDSLILSAPLGYLLFKYTLL
ncbi:MAG: phosphatidate cytidylyltransferase [Coraliomargaritaceae bacterium]